MWNRKQLSPTVSSIVARGSSADLPSQLSSSDSGGRVNEPEGAIPMRKYLQNRNLQHGISQSLSRTNSKDNWSSASDFINADTATHILGKLFFEAIEAGDLEEVEKVFRLDPAVIQSKGTAGPALHAAVRARNIPVINFLAANHADIHARDLAGNTALHLAATAVDADIVVKLLSLGLNPTAKNNVDNTPLHMAVRDGNMEILEILLTHPATDVNVAGQNGESPLHVAASLDMVTIFDLLLRSKANLWQTCYNGLRPIHLAAANNSVGVMLYLLSNEEQCGPKEDLLATTDDDQSTPLHAAVSAGHREIVKILLEKRASLRAETVYLTTPLHLACALGSMEMVRLICDTCSPKTVRDVLAMKDDHGMTPLHRAVMFGHWQLISILINKGANINEKDSEGCTPLIRAANQSANETVSKLLTLGANPSIQDNEGRNFLHCVLQQGGDQEAFVTDLKDDSLFSKLLNQKDKRGSTPLHYAAGRGFGSGMSDTLLNYSETLTSKDAQSRSPLHFAAEYGRYTTVKKLLQTDHGFSIANDSDRQGYTPLHLAARNGHTKVVQLLLANGALIHKGINGDSPLDSAVISDHYEIAELLVENYPYLVNMTDKNQNTALHTAARHNAARCVDFLLSENIYVSRNREGLTPMDVAVLNKSEDAAFAMVEHIRWREIVMQPSTVYGWCTHGLIQELPAVMKVVLDRCMTTAECHPLAHEYYEKFDYFALRPDIYWGSVQAGHIERKSVPLEAMNSMVSHKRYELLAHPVCKSYLSTKWMSYGIYLHFLNFAVYAVFLALLTHLILLGVEIDLKPRMTDVSRKYLFQYNTTVPQNISYFGPVPLMRNPGGEILGSTDVAFLYVVLIFTVCQLIKKMLQIFVQGWAFFRRPTNYFEIVCYLTSLVFAFSFLDVNDIYVAWESQWRTGAVAIFCAWFNLILHMQRYGKPGIYVGIFLRELRILFKAMSVYFIMVIAFSMCFCVLNPDKIFPADPVFYTSDHTGDSAHDWWSAHHTVQTSILRVSDMLVGDCDTISNYIDPILNDQMIFPNATYFLALTAIGVVTLLIQAILMGTAVYDLEKIARNSVYSILVMQVELHSDLESRMPNVLLRRFRKGGAVVYPNNRKWRILGKWLDVFAGKHVDELDDSDEDSDTEKTPEHSKLQPGKKSVKLQDVSAKIDQHNELLRLIAQRMHITVDTDRIDNPVALSRRLSQYSVREGTRPRSGWKKLQMAQNVISTMKRLSRVKLDVKQEEPADQDST